MVHIKNDINDGFVILFVNCSFLKDFMNTFFALAWDLTTPQTIAHNTHRCIGAIVRMTQTVWEPYSDWLYENPSAQFFSHFIVKPHQLKMIFIWLSFHITMSFRIWKICGQAKISTNSLKVCKLTLGRRLRYFKVDFNIILRWIYWWYGRWWTRLWQRFWCSDVNAR